MTGLLFNPGRKRRLLPLQAAAAERSRNTPVIQLRTFQRADLETLYRIDHICFPPGIAYSKAELRYYIQHPGSFTVIAETHTQNIAGFCTGQLQMREGRCFGHIITIDVLPDIRKQGVGRLLLRAMEEHFCANAAESIRLEVAVDNKEAQAFYLKMGYASVGTIRGYYGGRLDAIVMQKQLTAGA
jgi:ribosomal-protein-alanine N-acetyltransferase